MELASETTNEYDNEVQFQNDFIHYGTDNDYPYQLNELVKSNALHGSLVKGIAALIAGRGIAIAGEGENVEQLENIAEVITNSNNDTIYEILRAASEELKKNGYCYLEVIKKSKVLFVTVIPARFVRHCSHSLNKAPEHFKVCSFDAGFTDDGDYNWTNENKIPAFNGKATKSILFIRMPDTTTISYGAPDYEGALDDILLSGLALKHKVNSVENGFFPSALVNFNNGRPSQEEMQAIEAGFTSKFTGANGKTRIAFSWNADPESRTTFETFEPPNYVEFFKDLKPETQQAILNGHRVTSPLLFGIRDGSGGLGSNKDELIVAYDLMYENVIKDYQRVLIQGFSKIFNMAGIEAMIEIVPIRPSVLEAQAPTDEDGTKTPENAKAQEEAEEIKLARIRKEFPQEAAPELLTYLIDCGLTRAQLLADGWEEVEPVEIALAAIRPPDTQKNSKFDTEDFRVLYRYENTNSGRKATKIPTTREFCNDVINVQNSGQLFWRIEDIDKNQSANPIMKKYDYDVFLDAGGFNCRHEWKEHIFRKKKENKIKIPGGLPDWIKRIPIFKNLLK